MEPPIRVNSERVSMALLQFRGALDRFEQRQETCTREQSLTVLAFGVVTDLTHP